MSGGVNITNDEHERCSNIQGPCMSKCYIDASEMCSHDSENATDKDLNAGEIIAIVSSVVGVPLVAAICTMVVNRHSPQRLRDEFNAEVETTENVDGDGYSGRGNYHPQITADAMTASDLRYGILSPMCPERTSMDETRLIPPQTPTLTIHKEEPNWVKNFGLIV